MSTMTEDHPLARTLPETAKTLGLGLTKTHELIAAGHLDARKIGKRTVITTESIRAFLASLPKADIRTGRKAA